MLTGCNPDRDKTRKLSNNIAVFFHDFSLLKENPSLQLFINEKPIFESDSITKSTRQDIEINLERGQHAVLVQTKDGKFKTTNTLDVEKTNQRYLLSIEFHYNPPIDQYQVYLKNEIYKKTLNKNKLRPDTVIKWLMDSVESEFERRDKISMSLYKSGDRHFEIKFEEQPLLE